MVMNFDTRKKNPPTIRVNILNKLSYSVDQIVSPSMLLLESQILAFEAKRSIWNARFLYVFEMQNFLIHCYS